MKKIYLLMICVLIVSLFEACDIKKDFTFTIETKEASASNLQQYSTTDDINAVSASSDFDKYKDDIDNIEIVRTRYLVTYFTGTADQKINSAHWKIGDVNSTQSEDFASASNVYLMSVAAIDQELQMSSAGQQRLRDLIRNSPHQARVYFDATASSPVTFKVKLKIDIKVTYKKGFPYL
jgi:hypothetical protein